MSKYLLRRKLQKLGIEVVSGNFVKKSQIKIFANEWEPSAEDLYDYTNNVEMLYRDLQSLKKKPHSLKQVAENIIEVYNQDEPDGKKYTGSTEDLIEQIEEHEGLAEGSISDDKDKEIALLVRNEIKSYLTELVSELKKDMEKSPEDYTEVGSDDPSIDIRLQWHDDKWQVHVGSSDYDQNHKGFWGSSSVTPDTKLDDLLETLIDQVEEDMESSASVSEGSTEDIDSATYDLYHEMVMTYTSGSFSKAKEIAKELKKQNKLDPSRMKDVEHILKA
jgi:ribosomal protein S17E